MRENKTPKFPNKYLVLGVFTLLIGSLFLLWTLGFLPSFERLWPLPICLIGLFFLYLVFFQERSEVYILFGMILSLGGFFLLLITTILSERSLSKIWPGFMLITGISLLPYGIRKKKEKYKIAILIPAVAMIILSCLFFLFSLNITDLNFQEFISIWWPALIMIMGIALILLYLFNKKEP